MEPESCRLLRFCADGAGFSFRHARGAEEPKPQPALGGNSLAAFAADFGAADFGRRWLGIA